MNIALNDSLCQKMNLPTWFPFIITHHHIARKSCTLNETLLCFLAITFVHEITLCPICKVAAATVWSLGFYGAPNPQICGIIKFLTAPSPFLLSAGRRCHTASCIPFFIIIIISIRDVIYIHAWNMWGSEAIAIHTLCMGGLSTGVDLGSDFPCRLWTSTRYADVMTTRNGTADQSRTLPRMHPSTFALRHEILYSNGRRVRFACMMMDLVLVGGF